MGEGESGKKVGISAWQAFVNRLSLEKFAAPPLFCNATRWRGCPSSFSGLFANHAWGVHCANSKHGLLCFSGLAASESDHQAQLHLWFLAAEVWQASPFLETKHGGNESQEDGARRRRLDVSHLWYRSMRANLSVGRRGACTAVIEATGGNYAVAQALLRHKTMDTTMRVYKKQITPQGLLAGMQQFQKTLGK
jgi:hypothetical protein